MKKNSQEMLNPRNNKFSLKFKIILYLGLSAACMNNASALTEYRYTDTVPNSCRPVALNLPEANFTNPAAIYYQGIHSFTILERFRQILNAVPSGDSVYMSMFLFNDTETEKAIIKASTRGVYINLLVDSSREASSKQNEASFNVLRQIKKGNFLTVVNSLYDKKGNSGIDHNKFALFSKVETNAGILKYVIFQTSNNFTKPQCTYFQDNVILSNEGLYKAYRRAWQDIALHAKKNMDELRFQQYDDEEVHAYFFPKTNSGRFFGNDPVINILESIKNPSNAEIRIMMYAWNMGRKKIVQKLADLIEKGAHISILLDGGASSLAIRKELQTLSSKGAIIRIFNKAEGPIKKSIHSKYMLIEENENGKHHTLIATGSENYTTSALKQNNETLLLLKNSSLYQYYLNNFEKVKALK